MWKISRWGFSVAVLAGFAVLLVASQTRIDAGQAQKAFHQQSGSDHQEYR